MDLIGTFILQAQQSKGGSAANALVDGDFLLFVIGRLSDPGISVRKKVVSILRDLCLQPQPHPRYTEIAERLILCVRDSEESMQSQSVTIVYQMWFDRQQSHVRDRVAKAKLESALKLEGQQLTAAAPSSSPFTPQFHQLVHLIVGVMSVLYGKESQCFPGVHAVCAHIVALFRMCLLSVLVCPSPLVVRVPSA